MKTLWAILMAVGAFLAGLAVVFFAGDDRRRRMGEADLKRALARREREKQSSARARRREKQSFEASNRLLADADRAGARAAEYERQAAELAADVSKEIPDDERARRFNARHGLPQPGDDA